MTTFIQTYSRSVYNCMLWLLVLSYWNIITTESRVQIVCNMICVCHVNQERFQFHANSNCTCLQNNQLRSWICSLMQSTPHTNLTVCLEEWKTWSGNLAPVFHVDDHSECSSSLADICPWKDCTTKGFVLACGIIAKYFLKHWIDFCSSFFFFCCFSRLKQKIIDSPFFKICHSRWKWKSLSYEKTALQKIFSTIKCSFSFPYCFRQWLINVTGKSLYGIPKGYWQKSVKDC